MQTFFITGIGTDVGKTIVSAIFTEALQANYWKPVQAGYHDGTDKELVQNLVSGHQPKFFAEVYKLKLAASPHIAATEEGVTIDLDKICNHFTEIKNQSSANDILIIEGAGGIMVPLNGNEFVIDLIQKLNARVILVSRNYLGSINHSLLTSEICRMKNLDVSGWIFNDKPQPTGMNYEDEIVSWSGFPKIASIPFTEKPDAAFILQQAALVKEKLLSFL